MPALYTRAYDEFAFYREQAPAMEGRFSYGIMKTGRSWSEYEYLLLMRARDARVVAAAKLLVYPDRLWVAYLETAHDAKGHGYGRRLFSRIFAHAAAREAGTLELSQYTTYGQEYLAPREARLARRYYPQLLVTTSPSF